MAEFARSFFSSLGGFHKSSKLRHQKQPSQDQLPSQDVPEHQNQFEDNSRQTQLPQSSSLLSSSITSQNVSMSSSSYSPTNHSRSVSSSHEFPTTTPATSFSTKNKPCLPPGRISLANPTTAISNGGPVAVALESPGLRSPNMDSADKNLSSSLRLTSHTKTHKENISNKADTSSGFGIIPKPHLEVEPTVPGSDDSKMTGSELGDNQQSVNTNIDAIDLTNTVETTPVSNIAPIIGKLVVKIIEAKGLNIASQYASPYVVCMCDSSEFITNGPSLTSTANSMSSSINLDFKHSNINIHNDNTEPSTPLQAPSRPVTKRQYSNLKLSTSAVNPKNPTWKDEAMFDIFSNNTHLKIAIYDASNNDGFLGQIDFMPSLRNGNKSDKWYTLTSRLSSTSPEDTNSETISGEIRVVTSFERTKKTIMTPDDFEILSLIGKGTFGQVYQVRKIDTKRIYAMKVLSKKVIVQKKEIAHTIDERNILVRTASADSPFIIGLKFSFQTQTDLYLVTDYMSGGELFWHLQHEGRFGESRAKFYIAELILALEHLHNNDIVYRDLKPENILLDANGHIALCDFGLSKADLSADNTTNTFCGTTEYLAPEVLLDDQGYTKMVDFWSLGVLIFEMCCGWSPFYAGDTQQMYKNIAFGKVKFPKDALSQEGRNFVKGLLNRNPKHRLGAIDDARELKAHAFFADIDWDHLLKKQIIPPFKPHVTSEIDTSNFDPEFTGMSPTTFRAGQGNQGGINGVNNASLPLSPGIQAKFKGFTFVDDSAMDEHFHRYGSSVRHADNDGTGMASFRQSRGHGFSNDSDNEDDSNSSDADKLSIHSDYDDDGDDHFSPDFD